MRAPRSDKGVDEWDISLHTAAGVFSARLCTGALLLRGSVLE